MPQFPQKQQAECLGICMVIYARAIYDASKFFERGSKIGVFEIQRWMNLRDIACVVTRRGRGEVNCNGRRNLAFETIPTFHGRSDRHERHFTPGVRKRRTAFPVNGCLPIRTNVVMQRQKGCISVHPEFQFCRLNTNKLGREPRPRHPLNKERTICIIGVSLTQLYFSVRPQTNAPQRSGRSCSRCIADSAFRDTENSRLLKLPWGAFEMQHYSFTNCAE